MKEIWKDIKGYEGLYQVSNLGNVKSLERIVVNRNKIYIKSEIILKPYIVNGYYKVSLLKNKVIKKFYIHRLVADVFLGLSNYEKNYQVDHIDNNKLNNKKDNLQIITQKENIRKEMINLCKNISKYKNNRIITILKHYQ